MKKYKFVDLFCGIGGFRIALENNECECVFSCDIDIKARETYYENFGEYPAGDITLIDEKDIPDHDILCAGFPCQPFSIAGKRLGFDDTRGTLFFDVVRIIKEKKPSCFILENVAGIISHDKKNTIKIIEKTLTELEYVFKWEIMNAKDYGIPQNRNRWYCIGFKKDLRIGFNELFSHKYIFPQKKTLNYYIDDIIETKNVNLSYEITPTCKNNILKHLQHFKNSYRYNRNFLILANEVRFSKCNFRSDGICPCLTAKMGTGGNNIPVIVSQNRKLTERECLKIMGFPDDYIIKENYMQSYKQIGNSVVVPVIESLAEEVVKMLDETINKERD